MTVRRPSRRSRLLLAGMAVVLLAACGGRDEGSTTADPGITDSEIVLGTSKPLSGPASVYGVVAKGEKAYYDHVNEQGGVKMGDGKTRKIRYIAYDDGYAPDRTVSNVRKLVEQDKVFALTGVFGTPGQSAVVDYVNQKKVPDIFAQSVANKWSADTETYPWTIGWQPTSDIEGRIYAADVIENHPGARVAILRQNDEAGAETSVAFADAIKGTDVEIVKEETYEVADPTVDSQVAALARTKADVFLNVSSPKQAAQAIARAHELGWKPTQYLGSSSNSVPTVLKPAGLDAAKGVYSVVWQKDPSDPSWNDDPAIVEYREILAKYGAGADPADRLVAYGMAHAQTVVETLKRVEEPTRESLMKTVRSLEEPLDSPLLLPGIAVQTDEEHILPLRAMQLMQFDGAQWKRLGQPISADDAEK